MEPGAVEDVEQRVAELQPQLRELKAAIAKTVVGNEHLIDCLIMALLAQGHVLLEGLPGLAKTTAVKALADACDFSSSRIQFTPDLLPADVVGTQIYDPATSTFKTKQGPIFAHLVIADEINRAPAKVQSALLEAMQERQVTIGDTSFALPQPFLVMATQNPIEQEGTYVLPEAQSDRFLFKVTVDYLEPTEEVEMIKRLTQPVSAEQSPAAKPCGAKEFQAAQQLLDRLYVSDAIYQYIVDLVSATRSPDRFGLSSMSQMILCGASPRASINFVKAARSLALLKGRAYVSPQDIKDIAPVILRHRLILTYEAEADQIKSDALIRRILETVPVP